MSTESAPPLRCRNLSVAVPGRELVRDLGLTLEAGELVAVLGRNGTGKTLTLATLASLRPLSGGSLEYQGVPAARWPRSRLARVLSLLPQEELDLFPGTVLETALIGRHPHIGRWRWESAADRAIVMRELERVGLDGLAGRPVASLSGGERRRLAIAQTLVQQPAVYLLDEPVNHLDPRHQLEALTLFRERVDQGAAAIISLHDVNLASRFAHRILLLHGDGRWSVGPTGEVLGCASLEALYDTPMEAVDWRGGRLYVPAPRRSR